MKATDFLTYYLKKLPLLLLCVATLAACQPDEVLPDEPAPTETMTLMLQYPQMQPSARMGDPGAAAPETPDWDRLCLIFVYYDDINATLADSREVFVCTFDTLNPTNFSQLPTYNNTEYRLVTVKLKVGNVRIFGLTYSSDAANVGQLTADINACTNFTQVSGLTISNDYAQGDPNKFVSVAAGYYDADDDDVPDIYHIGSDGYATPIIPTMTLTRLASKLDIQWDAQDAYTAGYTNVKVTGFNYTSTTAGYLWPLLNGDELPTKGTQLFSNTSEISQRNGRVYHYVYSDCQSAFEITFNISANDKDGNSVNKDYSLTLNGGDHLEQATWYKINATIRGLTGSGTITLSNSTTP